MVAELRISTQHIIYHEAIVLVGVAAMHAIERQRIRQHVDYVAGAGDLQLDHQVFQANFRVEPAHLLKRFAPE
ncbi:hypothetical protein D3C80_1830730 [compost metagenome]